MNDCRLILPAVLATLFSVSPPAAWAQSSVVSGTLLADSRDALFLDDEPGPEPELSPAVPRPEQQQSSDSAVADDFDLRAMRPVATATPASRTLPWQGHVQFEFARTTAKPEHWSKLRSRLEVGSHGRITSNLKWKLGLRADYDHVFSINSFYPPEVRNNQRFELMLRETYLDYSAGDWDFRLGRQHVVWGEMVGMFFADVVSARDMREFLLPEFDAMRIPQWAARAEYFKDDFHAELLWIPVPSYDVIGKPGAEFYPYQPQPEGFDVIYQQEVRPQRRLRHGNYGLRLSTLQNGWDVSAFYYSSMDNQASFYRQLGLSNVSNPLNPSNPSNQLNTPTPTVFYEARHDRINQLGGTLAKDLGSAVLKGEAVYTQGRSITTLNPLDADGVVRQNTLDWALGLDFTLPQDTRFNVQFFQRATLGHDPQTIPKKFENGYSLYLNSELTDAVEAQIMWLSSLQRSDWLARPRVMWNFQRNWRLSVGADIFHGPPSGLFGRYEQQDRVYGELRYAF